VRGKVDANNGEIAEKWLAEHRHAIAGLRDLRRQEYEDIRAMTTERNSGPWRGRGWGTVGANPFSLTPRRFGSLSAGGGSRPRPALPRELAGRGRRARRARRRCGDALVLGGAEVAEARVAPAGVEKHSMYQNRRIRAASRVGKRSRRSSSFSRLAKKVSATALSQGSPTRPIDSAMPEVLA
jgi:hypothetical protein